MKILNTKIIRKSFPTVFIKKFDKIC